MYAVMAADLQEPPELILQMSKSLAEEDIDVVVGVREGRADPFLSRLSSIYFGPYIGDLWCQTCRLVVSICLLVINHSEMLCSSWRSAIARWLHRYFGWVFGENGLAIKGDRASMENLLGHGVKKSTI